MSAWFENLSIRSRIVLLMFGVMLPVAALLAWFVATDVRRARDSAHDKVLILATGNASDLQRMLDEFEAVLARASARPSVKSLDPAQCDPLVKEYMLLNPAALWYEVHDAQGRVVCQSDPNQPPQTRVPDAAWLASASPASGFRASNVYVDGQTGKKVAALSFPVHDERDAKTGLLVMTVDLLTLNNRLLAPTPKDAILTVVDRTRTVLLRSKDPGMFIGSRPAPGQTEMDSWGEAREGFFTATGRDGVPRLSAFVTLPGTDWRVAASLPEAEAFAEYKIAVLRTIGIGLGLCLLALVLAWRLSAAIVNPIAHLKETAGQLAAGNEAIRARIIGPPEIRSVAQQFNQMIDAQALSEARLRGIFESAVDAILTANEDQVIVQANPAAASMFRCSLNELVGAPLDRFVPLRYRERYARDIDALGREPVVSRRMGVKREVAALRSDGTEFPVEAAISHVSIVGRLLYTVILRDITERKQAEQELRASASKLQAALSSMSDAVCISDVEGRLIEFNDAFASFHGFPDKASCRHALEEYWDTLDMYMPDGEHATWEKWPLARALRGETAANVEYRLRRNDTGASLIGSYSFAPILSESGTIAGAVVAARNVTAIREVQADLASSHFALQRLIASRDQIQEEERKRIARELHDDLQQTLSAIRMDLHFIAVRFGEDAPELPPLVAGVDRLAERAIVSTRRIVNDLRPPMLEDLGLVPALEAMASQFNQQTGIACSIDAREEDISNEWVEAPSVAICLYRVAQEALNNVAKHSHAGEVQIRLAMATASSISLQVRDNGCGMAAADMRKHESFGILGIRERIRANGGIMRIDSRPDEGTVLEVIVPLSGAPGLPGHQAAPGQSTGRGEGEAAYAEFDDAHALPRLLGRATDKTLQDVIDAIVGTVAVMDRRGTIRFVNRAWTEFADHNGNPGPGLIGPGVNYLEVCRRSSASDESALRVLRGLEGVIYEGRRTYSCEYPCHSPDELRWFRMHVTPIANGDVMIAHFSIGQP